MNIRCHEACFTGDVPILRIRPSTSAESERSAGRWARASTRKLRRPLELAARAQRRGSGLGKASEVGSLVPWRELAAGWQQVLATFDGLFQSEEEEEQARHAYHHGGPRWRAFFTDLNQRKRDRACSTATGR